jgi:hypothetical protein
MVLSSREAYKQCHHVSSSEGYLKGSLFTNVTLTFSCYFPWYPERSVSMAQFVSTIKYARYAMGSLTAVLFLLCAGGS